MEGFRGTSTYLFSPDLAGPSDGEAAQLEAVSTIAGSSDIPRTLEHVTQVCELPSKRRLHFKPSVAELCEYGNSW